MQAEALRRVYVCHSADISNIILAASYFMCVF
jgi:hypothetical protein